MKTELELKSIGFTDSGITRYVKTATAYCEDLCTKSTALGDRDKSSETPREVTHDHVRSAASEIASKGKETIGRSQILCQIGEYVCAALAGVGGGKLETSFGIILFGLSLTVGVVLFVIRNLGRSSK